MEVPINSEGPTQETPEQDFGIGPETFFDDDEAPGQETPGQENEPKLSPEEVSARHFQSLYDKSQAELSELKQQMQMQGQYLQQMFLMQQQGQQPSGGQAQVNPHAAVRESATSLQKPARPQRPQNYDPIDATTDPASESFRYREGMEQYMEQMADYMSTVESQAMQKAEAIAQRQAQQMQVNAIRTQLKTGYGMSDEELDDFWRTMDDPNGVTLDSLVKFYRTMKGGSQPPPAPRSRMPLPPVPTSVGAKTQDVGRVEDRIMDDMVRQFNGLNIND